MCVYQGALYVDYGACNQVCLWGQLWSVMCYLFRTGVFWMTHEFSKACSFKTWINLAAKGRMKRLSSDLDLAWTFSSYPMKRVNQPFYLRCAWAWLGNQRCWGKPISSDFYKAWMPGSAHRNRSNFRPEYDFADSAQLFQSCEISDKTWYTFLDMIFSEFLN